MRLRGVARSLTALLFLGVAAASCSKGSGNSSATTGTSPPSSTVATTSTSVASGHPLTALRGVGVNVVPVELLDGMSQQPPGVSEGPGAANGTITDLNAVIGREESVLNAIKAQFGGAYPSDLVALDVYNEPVLDAQTVGSLQQLASAIKTFSGGIPTCIGGWSDAGARTAQQYNDPSQAGLAASIGDFVQVHLYPANMPGGSATAATVGAILPFAQSFFQTAVSSIATSGHSGVPILLGETGGENGQAPGGGFQQGGSPAHQAATIQAVLQVAKQYVPQGVDGALIWWMTPPPAQACNGSALVCFNGYVSPAVPLIAQYPFN